MPTFRPEPRTSHTNMYNAPDFVLSTEDPRWCAVCRCWDLGLVESADGRSYTHPDHEGNAMPDQDSWYIRHEFGKARPFNAADPVRIKVESADGKSRWVHISSHQFEQIINTLAPTTGNPSTEENQS